MRIGDSFRPLNGLSRPASASAGGVSFSAYAPAGRMQAGAAPLAARPQLFAAILPDHAERRRRAVKRGRALLDALDEAKASLLAGRDATAALAGLMAQAGDEAPEDDRPLADVLDAIRVRAEVELAKAEMRALSKDRPA